MAIWNGIDDGEILFSLNKASNDCSGAAGATAVATVQDGQVTEITVTNGGEGYCGQPQVFIAGGGGSGATATANLAAGMLAETNAGRQVESITVTNGGSGYTCPPAVTIGRGIWKTAEGMTLDEKPTPLYRYERGGTPAYYELPGKNPDDPEYWVEYTKVSAVYRLVGRYTKKESNDKLAVDLFKWKRLADYDTDPSYLLDGVPYSPVKVKDVTPAQLMGGNNAVDAVLDDQPEGDAINDIRMVVVNVSTLFRSIPGDTGWQVYNPLFLNVDRVNKTMNDYETPIDSYEVGNC